MTNRPSSQRSRLERAARVVTVLTLIVVAGAALIAHGLFLRNAGGLWRDEANTVAFAQMESLPAIASALQYDSVPLASTLLVRAWIGLGLGSDGGLRTLGFLVGLAIVAALAVSAWRLGAPLPACSVLLFVLNPWVIRGGDAIRPLGLGMLFIILSFAVLGLFLERPRPWLGAVAALCAVLSVQSIYSDAPLVAAIALAGIAVGVIARSPVRVLVSAGVGLAAGLSLLPYLPAVRAAREWGVLVQVGADLSRFQLALGSAVPIDTGLWILLAVGGVVVAAAQIAPGARRDPALERDRRRALYAGLTLVGGIAAFCGFIVWSNLMTQPWHYLPLMALVAVSLDALAGPLLRPAGVRIVACAVLVVATALHLVAAAAPLRVRQTNLDLVAATLGAAAAPNDLVLIHPWYYGVTFHRYYAGPAPWMTIPALANLEIHRWDQLARCMQQPTCVDSVARAVADTLAAGGRVWLIGTLPDLAEGEIPPRPPPAPAPGLGWNIDAYGNAWANVVQAAFLPHLRGAEAVPVPVPGPVNDYERVPLFRLDGARRE